MPAGVDGFDAESLLRSLMGNVSGAIYRAACDSAWTLQRVSGEIEEITGYPAADFVDASMLESITHHEEAEAVRVSERHEAERLRVEHEMERLRTAELEASRARIIAAADAARRCLVPAVEALVRRCAVPVAFEEELGPRLPTDVETALYFAIAEGLTNVDRYARASNANVRVRRDDHGVEVAIADDGRDGADRTRGTGLRGLEDRLAAVGGALDLDSPAGGGTRLRVRVPLAAADA